ncbi:MAG TPA: site-2 protease family protein [Actinocrinis sp.]|nr:site-2 protease family protein [Actinocrinis sp.]
MKISPVFLGILAVTIAGGVALWLNFGNAYVATFVFVLGAYFVVLCLHEFGHAYSAHRAGDAEVAARGYLDLNPLRYVNPVLSIILPIFYVAIGGLPLPGGSVLVNPGVARQKWRASLISAAGPLTNVVFAVIAMVVVAAAVPDDFAFFTDTHQNFWGAVAFFAYLQVAVAILNLIPVPGLDGYGIIEPYLRYETRRSLEPIRQYGILLVLVLLYFAPPIRNGFSNAIDSILNAFGMAPGIAGVGAQHMKFWQQ